MSESRPGVEAIMGNDDLAKMCLRVFMDAADPIVIEDLTGQVIEMNQEAQQAYGWSRSELIGQPIKRLVPDERHSQADDLLRRCLAGEAVRNVEGLRVSREGEVYNVRLTLSLLRGDDGEAVAVASIAKDITELRKATRLMGCECTISGVSAPIAQTMVELGIDVGDVRTTAKLQDALAEALRLTGTEIRDVR